MRFVVAGDNGDLFGGVAAIPNQHTRGSAHSKRHGSECD